MSAIVKQYETKLDAKKRLLIRKSKYAYFLVKEFDDGHIVLEPKVLVSPDEISENTLQMMDEAVNNFKSGTVSDPIDFENYLDTGNDE